MEKQKTMIEKNEVKEAVARGNDLPISTKHSIAICRFLKNKNIDYSIKFLEEVVKVKKAVPMKGEIPHRHNMGEGRYPVNASKVFIKLLKNLKANASAKGIDSSKLIIEAKADRASRPRKPGKYRRKFKRTHVMMKGVLKA